MNLTLLDSLLTANGFTRSPAPLSFPVVIHGVPGCGKSTLIRRLLSEREVEARTAGAPYGSTLFSKGVLTFSATEAISAATRILDEYQHVTREDTLNFNILFGDPFQGTFRLEPHYIKKVSHRVPDPICSFLTHEGFDISGVRPGRLVRCHPYEFDLSDVLAQPHQFIHLGLISQQLANSHQIPSSCITEVAGLEFDNVVVLYHSSEKIARPDLFYVACTRSKFSLTLLADEFHELQTTT